MSGCESVNSRELFKRGKQCYIEGNYSKAVDNLSKSCSLMSSEKIDTCDELFEPYLYYAKALYMLSRFSPNLIEVKDKNIFEKDNKLGDFDENFYISKIVKESENIEAVDNEKNKRISDVTEVKSNLAIHFDDKEVIYNIPINDDNEEENKTDSDDNMGNILMARENIRCAKLILQCQLSDKELSLAKNDLEFKMADCYDLSADIYVEKAFKKAIDENKKALKLRCKNIPSYNRLIAESYYKIAMLYSVNYRCAEAKLNFERCRYVLEYIRNILLNNNTNTDDIDSFLLRVIKKIAEVSKEVPGSSLKPQADVNVGDIDKLDRTNEIMETFSEITNR